MRAVNDAQYPPESRGKSPVRVYNPSGPCRMVKVIARRRETVTVRWADGTVQTVHPSWIHTQPCCCCADHPESMYKRRKRGAK